MRLRALRDARGISQKVISDYLGCSTVVYSRYETGARQPSMETLQRLAEYYDVTIDYLVGNSSSLSTTNGTLRIPVLGTIRAGIPVAAIEHIEDWEAIDAAMAKTGKFIALRVKGDSMEPHIKNGDVAIIRRQEAVDNGDIAVVLVNSDEAILKKVKRSPDGIMLVGFNTEVYEPHFYSNVEITEFPVRI